MQANDAMRILGSAAAMGLLGGGGALAYNARTKPIVDEYGNVIESNDIDPVMAALGSAAIGAVGGGIYGKMNQPIARPAQGMASADMNIQNEIDDLRNEIAITRQGIEEYKKTRKAPEARQSQPQQSPDIDIDVTPSNPKGWNYVAPDPDEIYYEAAKSNYEKGLPPISQQDKYYHDLVAKNFEARQRMKQLPMVAEPEVMPSEEMPIQESVAQQTRFVPQLSSEQEALYAEANRLGISPYELERRGWKYNPNQPTIQIVPASPMQMQKPMTWPGMRTVVVRPIKEPGQEMMEEALRLKELAYQQRQQRQMDARLALGAEGWNTAENRWRLTNYPEDRQQNLAGWDLVDPSPEAASYRRELISDTNRYRQWHENHLEAQKKRA